MAEQAYVLIRQAESRASEIIGQAREQASQILIQAQQEAEDASALLLDSLRHRELERKEQLQEQLARERIRFDGETAEMCTSLGQTLVDRKNEAVLAVVRQLSE